MTKVIDAHAHIFPSSFGPAPASCDPASWPSTSPAPDVGPGAQFLNNGPMKFPARAVWFDAEKRLEASAASGLDAELLSPFPALLPYKLDPAAGRDLSKVINSYIAGLVSAFPGRFYGLGMVPLQDPDGATSMLKEILDQGLLGVEVGSNVNGESLHTERYDGFWSEASRLGASVFVHGMPVPSPRLPGPATATFGVGAEATIGAAAIITGGVVEKYPDLRISFSHAGGGLPMILGRANWFWGRTWNEEPPVPESERPEAEAWFSPHSPTELARRCWYDSLVMDHRGIRFLADLFGTDKLLVGSDFPAMGREDPIARTLRGMEFSGSELDAMLWHNAFAFLGLEVEE